MKNDGFLHAFCSVWTVFGIWSTNLGSICQFVASGSGSKCVRFNEREDYPVVVFHDGLSKASPVLRSSQSQKGVFQQLLLGMFGDVFAFSFHRCGRTTF